MKTYPSPNPPAVRALLRCFVVLMLAGVVTGARAESLWKNPAPGRVTVAERSMFADKRAFAVGNILSIVVQENNTATKDTSTKSSKSSSMDASIASFLYSPANSGLLTKGGSLPAMKFNSKHDFDGGGTINNAEKIVARVAATVIDVLPNGNLVLEGRRQTAFAGETQDVILRGVVRPEDIAANNTVFSYNIAEATIKIISTGSVSNTQKKGWFTRTWEKFTPF